ncbi:VWA domain-containing protein [Thermomonas haemolytica]|uniref:Ca-activated chloride channel family protein n=2 Tax=Thermomonas haemolytica TaxID=141949 RepID=A0A4R3N6K3_9GAMM|nr:VWA domain-containing protein [Thermomonas haemolytica]TCT24725.1 Ca-activated chloride channel family protein [Thermomonas haemolytica]
MSIALLPEGLHFLRPWWLLGLLALPVLALWLRRAARRRSGWQQAVDAHLLPHLLEGGTATRRAWAEWLGLLGAALAVLALAGPSTGKRAQPLWQNRQPLVLALDLSSAMLARDLPPNRLAQVRAKLATLLRERSGGEVALVVFADDAYTVAPLTDDAANVALFLDALAPDVMPADGHQPARAIAWSQRLLQQAGFARGEILLLTDHADAEALAAAARARAAGYTVSALGVGSARGGVFPGPGGLGQARLDAASLRALAAAGGGRYQAMTAGDADLRALGVLQPQSSEGEAAGQMAQVWRDDGFWLLPLVLLCVLPLFRRGVMAAMLLVALGWPSPPAAAQEGAPRGTLWQRADQAAHARRLEGVAAYRRGDYATAIARFSGLPDADSQYDLGNALAQAGRYDEALAAYDRALRLRPGMADAIYNRKLVEAARQRKSPPPASSASGNTSAPRPGSGPPASGQKEDGRGQGSKDAAGKNGAPPPSPAQDRSGAQAAGKMPDGPPQPSQPSPEQALAQAQADAAQRARMQQALQGRPAGGAPMQATPAPRPETAEERERRLANQAWLQRVPDDPGALLRARLQLEARRRAEAGGP